MKYIALLIIACLLLAVPSTISQERPLTANVIELLANPEKFNEKSVTVRGFLLILGGHHDIVSYFLYLHREDAENELENGVSVTPTEQMTKDREKIDRMYVTLTGSVHRVRAANGSYITVIKDIRGCAPWSDPNHPILLKADNKSQNK